MITTQATSSPAWLGYRSAAPLTVGVCGWCADGPAVTRWARESGCAVTHGICRRCYAAAVGRLTGEREGGPGVTTPQNFAQETAPAGCRMSETSGASSVKSAR